MKRETKRNQQEQRRKAIADEVASGRELHEVAEHFETSNSFAYFACKEHGVPIASSSSGCFPDRKLRIICELLTTTKTYTRIAQGVGVSREYVRQIAQAITRLGIDIRSARTKSPFSKREMRLHAANLLRIYGDKEVADIMGVSVTWAAYVRSAFKIEDPTLADARDKNLDVKLRCLAMLINSKKSQRRIAKELGLKNVAVSWLAKKARDAGLNVPVREIGTGKAIA